MPAPVGANGLTGAIRYRTGFRGVLVLQVEEKHVAYWKDVLMPGVQRTPVYEASWRDAHAKDLRVLEYLARNEEATTLGVAPPPPPDL